MDYLTADKWSQIKLLLSSRLCEIAPKTSLCENKNKKTQQRKTLAIKFCWSPALWQISRGKVVKTTLKGGKWDEPKKNTVGK